MTKKEEIIKELTRVRDGFTPDPYMTLEDDISVFANALIYIINTLDSMTPKKPVEEIGYIDKFINGHWDEVRTVTGYHCPECNALIEEKQKNCTVCKQSIEWGAEK